MGIEPAPADASKTFPQQDQYNQWMASMQGYYNSQMGPGSMPPSGFMPPAVPGSSSGGGHPYMWGPQAMMPPYPPPLPGMPMSMPGGFPGVFPSGMFPHPSMPPASAQGEDAGGRGRGDNGSSAGPPLGSGGAMAPPRVPAGESEPRSMAMYGMAPGGLPPGPLQDMQHQGASRSPEQGPSSGGGGQKVVARKPSSGGADSLATGKGGAGLGNALHSGSGGGVDGVVHEPQPSRLSPPGGDMSAPTAIKPHAQSHVAVPHASHSVYRSGVPMPMSNGGVGVPSPAASMAPLGGMPSHALGTGSSGKHVKSYDKPRGAAGGPVAAPQGPMSLSGNVRDHQGRLKKDPACQPSSSNYENSSDWDNSSDSQDERKVSVSHRRPPGDGYGGGADASNMDLRRSISGGDSKQALNAIACDGAELWGLQDEREVKRQRRKQSNRESARRSRLRKQAECEELGSRVESLTMENMHLRDELRQLHTTCNVLGSENALLQEQLRKIRFPVPASGDNPSGASTPALASVTMPSAEPAASAEGSGGASQPPVKDAKEREGGDKPAGAEGAEATAGAQHRKPRSEGGVEGGGEGEGDVEREGGLATGDDSASSVPATKRAEDGAVEAAEHPGGGNPGQGVGTVKVEEPEGKAMHVKQEGGDTEGAATSTRGLVPATSTPCSDSPGTG